MKKWSIKTRFSVAILALLVIALGTVLSVVLTELRTKFQRTLGENLGLLVTSHANALDTRFEHAQSILQSIADQAPAAAFQDPELAQRYVLQQTSALGTFDLGLYIANADEVLLGVHLSDPQAAQKRRGSKTPVPEINRRARESHQLQISPPYASPSCAGCPAVVLVTPIFNEKNTLLGYVAGAIRLDGNNFLATLRSLKIGAGGYFYLVTKQRMMIMHPDPARIMKTATQPGQNLLLDQAIDHGFEGYGETINSTGTAMIVAFHQMKSTGWLLAANYPKSEAEQPFEAARNKVYLMTVGAGLLILIAVWLIAYRMLAPLSVLSRHVAKLPESPELHQINLHTSGEIGTLESAFNQMISKLDRQQEVQRQTESEVRHLNTNLEALVKDRTAALEATNRQLEEVISRLTLAQNELVEAEKMAALGALVAGIAHELNTPIGNCVLVASKLDQDTNDLITDLDNGQIRHSRLKQHLSQNEEAIRILCRNLDKAAALITSFKQTAIDRTTDARRNFDLAEVIHDTLLTMRPSLTQGKCTAENLIPHGIMLNSFPGSLSQSLSALLENAKIHAYDGQGGPITLRAETHHQSVTLYVSDQGSGISSDHLKRIFEPFFTTRLGQGGSGLGLNIVYNIITNVLGGKISVSSAPHQGTTFSIELPLTAPNALA